MDCFRKISYRAKPTRNAWSENCGNGIFSSSSDDKWHYGKYAKQEVVDCSRHRVSACEIVSYCQAPKPQHKYKFGDQQKSKCSATHCKSARQLTRHSETAHYPSRCDNDDYEHDRRFQQLSYSCTTLRNDPKYSNRTEHKARSKYECKIQDASLY